MTPSDGVAWVTGASSGIGRELCLALAKRGWRVAATARSVEALEALAAEARKGEIRAFPADVTDKAAMAATVARIEDEFDRIALAVFNAGVYLPVDAPRLDVDKYEASFGVNVFGTVHGLAPLIPRMVARDSGHIAIVSSVAGYGGLPTSSAYGATKAALIHIAEALKVELDRWGVRTSLICPGFVDTPAQDDNAFPKPFIISAPEAAARIVRGLRGQAFEISFPKRFTYGLKLLHLLPAKLRLELVKKQTGWDKRPEDGGMKGPED